MALSIFARLKTGASLLHAIRHILPSAANHKLAPVRGKDERATIAIVPYTYTGSCHLMPLREPPICI